VPAVAPLPPQGIREVLEAAGYELIRTDDYNWMFAKSHDDEPILVPYKVDLVPLDICFHVAVRTGFNGYFDKFRELSASDKDVH
jgi:hypothetical protein